MGDRTPSTDWRQRKSSSPGSIGRADSQSQPRPTRRYQVTGTFSNFLRTSFSSLHATRPVRTSFSVAVTV